MPKSGTIILLDGTIVKTSLTILTYKGGTLTYDLNGKLIIEGSKKELIASDLTEAILYGYRGNIDYNDNALSIPNQTPQTSRDVEIAFKVKINKTIYNVTSIGKYVFRYSSIKSITVPSTVTDMRLAFLNSDVTTININKPYGTVPGYENKFGVVVRNITVNWLG